ncbi:MAG: hypothetical protein ABIQ88_22795 [Chitinophagaceae bacterium]
MPNNFHLAPDAKIVDGLLAVPMDIQQLQASVVFNAATSTASATSTITFITGQQNGCPVFDLRQTIGSATLDGLPILPADLALHNFGGGANAGMRIINRVLPAGTTHTLQVVYTLALPQSPAGGSYQPNIAWAAGPRLIFNFGFTDLAPARYLEAWFPANLIFDQFSIELDLQLINTAVVHAVITNAAVTALGSNHWKLNYPARSTALSTLLEIRAADTVQHQGSTVTLPVSGNTITIDAWKLVTGAADLSTQINNIKTFLTSNENNYGPYLHGNRFTVFFNIGGMEYDGGATTGTGALKHETFHSWWARGMKPASQPDGWWDEAWTTYFCDNAGAASTPFDFTAAPVELCAQNQWSRITDSEAYTQGNRFWQGMSAMLGNANLLHYMKDFFSRAKNELVKTNHIEEYLLCRSGNAQLVDAFHRFVYGFANPAATPDLWLKDDATDALGNNDWNGRFWDSPDIWVRNKDDGGLTQQSPEFGQDNWFYARVRNKSSSVTVKHFVVAFNVKQFAGTQFRYPNDFFPATAAASGFTLAPGASMIVKAKWPKKDVPPAGSHACLLASVITRSDHPVNNKFVWESNNLAQKNLTIVDLRPNQFILLPFVVTNQVFLQKRVFDLQVFRPPGFPAIPVSLLHPNTRLFSNFRDANTFTVSSTNDAAHKKDEALDCGGHVVAEHLSFPVITNSNIRESPDLIDGGLHEMQYADGENVSIRFPLKKGDQLLLHLKVMVPANIPAKQQLRFDVVQRDTATGKITGGIALLINVIN